MDPTIAELLGRIEGKVEGIATTITTQGQDIARHDERIRRVETDVEKLQDHRVAEDRQGVSFRAALTVALCTVVASGGASALVAALTR
jgi:hypothetical protein